MGALIVLGIYLIAFLIPIVAKILLYFDYVIVLFSVWAFVFGFGGMTDRGLLSGFEIHTVFVILIYIAAVAIWFGLQNIRVFKIYIFRILGAALTAFVLVSAISGGLFGQDIADGMDTIWQWAIGIVYFALSIGLRAKEKTLMYEE